MKNNHKKIYSIRRKKKEYSSASIKKALLRKSIEAVFMITLGIYLINILNSLPNKHIWFDNLFKFWNEFIVSIISLYYTLFTLLFGLIVVIGLLFSSVLLLGGISRIVRIVAKIHSIMLKRNKRIFKNK